MQKSNCVVPKVASTFPNRGAARSQKRGRGGARSQTFRTFPKVGRRTFPNVPHVPKSNYAWSQNSQKQNAWPHVPKSAVVAAHVPKRSARSHIHSPHIYIQLKITDTVLSVRPCVPALTPHYFRGPHTHHRPRVDRYIVSCIAVDIIAITHTCCAHI
jgi:hypothetical protein